MAKARVNPFRGFVDMISEMQRIREVGRTGLETGPEDRQRTHATAWAPAANIFARDRDLVIRVELTDVEPKDIDITFSDGVLTISGERGSEADRETVTFYTRELSYGPFRRSMILPEDVDEGDISAAFEDGITEITVRGACASVPSEPRRIPVIDRSRPRSVRS